MHVMIMPDTIMKRLGPCRDMGTSTSRYGQKRNNVAMSMSRRPISCQYNTPDSIRMKVDSHLKKPIATSVSQKIPNLLLRYLMAKPDPCEDKDSSK